MKIILITMTFLQIIIACFPAVCIYKATQQKWPGILLLLVSSLAPFSFVCINTSVKYSSVLDFLRNISHISLGFTFYFFIICFCIYLINKVNPLVDFRKLMAYGFGATLLLLVGGFINAMNPQTKKIVIPAHLGLKICFVSDIHVGSIGTTRTLSKISELIYSTKPDLIILGGDILDFNGPQNYREIFLQIMGDIAKKYPTYAVIGNHEIYTNPKICIELLQNAGIKVLLDEYTEINFKNHESDFKIINDSKESAQKSPSSQKIAIIGRLDGSVQRKSLKEIINNAKTNLDSISTPELKTIVVEHTPGAIDESVENGIFLHLSGHTHGGQMFPLNLITNFIYKKTGVLHKDRNTYSYISCGAGFWGPPYRIGNTPEVVLIEGL